MLRLQRLLPQPSNLKLYDDDDDIGIEELDFHVSYRRPTVIENEQIIEPDTDDLSDYVKDRLLIARCLALRKYEEKWG
jgi:hypothetical protein